MSEATCSFGRFQLDPVERRLSRDGAAVDVTGRYLDALVLLVAERGQLVTKERFHAEVWRGIPVTDEALTQCIRTLRRALGDDAAAPRYIETVPRHGYRFVAMVETYDTIDLKAAPRNYAMLLDGGAAALGGAAAGIVGGLGCVTAGLVAPGIGAASTLMVLVSVNLLLGSVAGAGVGLGIAAAYRSHQRSGWVIVGGAMGGLAVGAVARMLGTDLFELVLGRSPGPITGAFEGLLLGAAAGLGVWLSTQATKGPVLRRALPGFFAGGVAGLAISLLGGRLMVGSLAELAMRFPGSRLRLDHFGALFGEHGIGPISLSVATTLEGALFTGFVAAALILGRSLRGVRE